MATILITGGTGMIGKALTRALIGRGDKVIILTRSIPSVQYGSKVSYALWDIKKTNNRPGCHFRCRSDCPSRRGQCSRSQVDKEMETGNTG